MQAHREPFRSASSCRRIQLSSALKKLVGVDPAPSDLKLDPVDQGNLRGRGIVMGAGADSAAIERSALTHFAGLPRVKARGRLRSPRRTPLSPTAAAPTPQRAGEPAMVLLGSRCIYPRVCGNALDVISGAGKWQSLPPFDR